MDRPDAPVAALPQEGQPLVSRRDWAIIADAFKHTPVVLDDLRVVVAQLSPGVRRVLIDNLVQALASGGRPAQAVWTALATTGHDVMLRSATLLGRLDALDDDAPEGEVRQLWPAP